MKIIDFFNSRKVKKNVIKFIVIYLCVFIIETFNLKYITGNKIKMSNALHWGEIIEQLPNRIFPMFLFTVIVMWILSKADKGN